MPTALAPPTQASSLFATGPPTYVPGTGPSSLKAYSVAHSPMGTPTYVSGTGPSPLKGYSAAHSHYSDMKARTKQLRLASNPMALEVCTISYSVEAQFGKQSKVVFVSLLVDVFDHSQPR